MLKRTEITIERETLVIRRGGHIRSQWCPACASVVGALSVDAAALSMGVRSRTILQWIDDNLIHFGETSEGLLWVCPESIHDLTEGDR